MGTCVSFIYARPYAKSTYEVVQGHTRCTTERHELKVRRQRSALPFLKHSMPALWVEGLSHKQEDAEACWHDPSMAAAVRAWRKEMTTKQQQTPLLLELRDGSWKEAAWHICKRSEWTPCENPRSAMKTGNTWAWFSYNLFFSFPKMRQGMPCRWLKKLRVLLVSILAV